MITAFVLIDAEPDHIAELAPSLAETDGVREAHSVAGGEADVVAIIEVPDHEAVAEVVTERVAKLPGVRSTRTLIAFRRYTSAQLDAAYEGFS
jgi:DNA-binding Lrp family transcriptional regulator